MSAAGGRAGRFVLAPVVDGAAAWDRATDVVVAPIRLAAPVRVVLSGTSRTAGPR